MSARRLVRRLNPMTKPLPECPATCLIRAARGSDSAELTSSRQRQHVCRSVLYVERVRPQIKQSPDPMYAEFEVHRTMLRDRVRTEAFRRAIDTMVRPGDIVL